jgi:hypothetical protein
MTPQDSRRTLARFRCNRVIELRRVGWRRKFADARLVDIGMGGASILCDTLISMAESYDLHLSIGKELLDIRGTVCWIKQPPKDKPPTPKYGLKFQLSAAQESSMKIIIDKLRTEQWPDQDEWKFKNYWNW